MHSVRSLALAAAYAAAVVTGTALLIAAFADDGSPAVTRSEVVMQQATERALVSPQGPALAANQSNDKRGM